MRKPIIIGQAPARGNEGKPPFAGKSGRKLAQMAGVGESGDDLPDHFELHNLIQYWPGKDGKGDDFPIFEAKGYADRLRVSLVNSTPGLTIFLMGHKVKECFGFRGANYLQRIERDGHTWIPFPHPSGVNRWYNIGVNREAASRVLREVLNGGKVKG